MSIKTLNQKNQSKTPREVLDEQLSLALTAYFKAELSERVKLGLARRKAAKQ